MNDKYGNVLEVGDRVAYCTSGNIYKGSVVEFSPKKIRIQNDDSRYRAGLHFSDRVIKI